MGISQYIKEIGRGRDGARALSREQACDLFGQVLDGAVTDLEVGAFCLAMRIKGETPTEMAGFLDATYRRMQMLPATDHPIIVLPSYNGARKLPVLTPLLALLLARRGMAVLVHGTATESNRVIAADVLRALNIVPMTSTCVLGRGEVGYAPTELLCAGLKRLLDVRRVVGLRNPAHSLVKLMAPCVGPQLVIGSYTHPEYAVSMAETFTLMQTHAMLLRGTEGEVVADPRRMPRMESFISGQRSLLQEAQPGSLTAVPDLPSEVDARSTAAFIRAVVAGERPVPASIARQVDLVEQLANKL